MHPRRCVILEHVTRDGRHYDWLFEHPGGVPGHAALWAGRLALPSRAWHGPRRLLLTRLPDHRRRYLGYQGPLTRGRGVVRRLDAGRAWPIRWAETRAMLRLELGEWAGLATLTALTADTWAVTFRPASREKTLCGPAEGS